MKVSEDNISRKAVKIVLSLALLLLFGASPSYGQISFKSHEKHGQKMRQSLKEAEQIELAHKETHLNPNTYTFRKGAPARKRVKQDERNSFHFNERGKPMKWTRFFKKKKYRQLNEEVRN
jgi:hypothetical protein